MPIDCAWYTIYKVLPITLGSLRAVSTQLPIPDLKIGVTCIPQYNSSVTHT